MNPLLELVTVAVREDGCFSAMVWMSRPFAVAVERTFENTRPILGNAIYTCKRDYYYHGEYETFEIQVSGHDRVLFHKGNTEDDSLACVCVAESFGMLAGKTAVLDSKHGFEEFMQLTKGINEFKLWVRGR